MDSNPLHLIEKWFSDHDGDGEFALHERNTQYSVVGPAHSPDGRVLFTTKPKAVIAAVGEWAADERLVIVGGYGLPSLDDVRWVGELARNGRLAFLGDMDPVDLLTYAWLRGSLQPLEIAFLGIGDAFLRALATDLDALPQIPLSPPEQQSLALLWQAVPDLRRTVGYQCAQRLRDGFKLEFEATAGVEKMGSVLRS